MTLEKMIERLIDKGHGREFAVRQASHDFVIFNSNVSAEGSNDCSVCRGTFTDLEYRYHYHPCE